MEEKYIELLINKCTNLNNVRVLLINYSKEIQPFIDKLVAYAKKIGVNDIYLDCEDKYKIYVQIDLRGEVYMIKNFVSTRLKCCSLF